MNAIGYVRISTRDQSNYSLEFQEDRIREYCQRNKVNLVSIYKDDGESSYTFDRPDYLALENFIKEHKRKVQYLIIWDHDRFSRNMPEALTKIDQLEKKHGLKVLECSEPLDLDTSDPNVFIQRAFKYLMANAELFRIRKRVKNGIRQAQLSGRFVHVAPFGYINSKDNDKRSMLLIDDTKAFIIQKIFRDYLNDIPKYIIHAEVRKLGYNVNGSSAIARTLSNGTYAGLVKVGADKAEPERYVKGVHKAIISEDQYWIVQEKLGNKRVTLSQPKEEFPLRGILLSPCCGCVMTAGWSKGKSKHYLYYRCIKHSTLNISGALLHETFEKVLIVLNFTEIQLDRLMDITSGLLKDFAKQRKKEAIVKTDQLSEIESKIEKLEQKMISDDIEVETYKKYYRKFTNEKLVLKEELSYLKGANEQKFEEQKSLIPQLSKVSQIYKESQLSSRHAFLKRVFKQGITFINGAFRTPRIDFLFRHNLQELNEKGLLFEEQPFEDSGGIPSGGAGGIRTLVQTWYKVGFLHAYLLLDCREAEGQLITYTTSVDAVSRPFSAPQTGQFHFSVPLLPVQRNRTPAGQKLVNSKLSS